MVQNTNMSGIVIVIQNARANKGMMEAHRSDKIPALSEEPESTLKFAKVERRIRTYKTIINTTRPAPMSDNRSISLVYNGA